MLSDVTQPERKEGIVSWQGYLLPCAQHVLFDLPRHAMSSKDRHCLDVDLEHPAVVGEGAACLTAFLLDDIVSDDVEREDVDKVRVQCYVDAHVRCVPCDAPCCVDA